MEELDSWLEWRQRCALGLCSPLAQGRLRTFVKIRFLGFLSKFAFLTNAGAAPALLEPSDPWHLFETHLMVKNTRAGKSYKEWLFARTEHAADDDLTVLQGGATLLVRDVVREFLRHEHSPATMVSLNQPLGSDDGALSLEELLPSALDPRCEVERREFEGLAAQHAGVFFDELSRRERVALLAKELGLSLAHPAVQQTAGCGKSMVNDAYGDMIRRVSARLKADYDGDDSAAVMTLCLLTLAALARQVVAWAESENECAPLFLLVGQASYPSRETGME